MKYEHRQIKTEGQNVEIGEVYDFREGHIHMRVQVLSHKQNADGIRLFLKNLTACSFAEAGLEFEVFAAHESPIYGGTWQLLDVDGAIQTVTA